MPSTRIPAGTRDIRALDWLRMPLAICVIFIHSFGIRQVNYDRLVSEPFSWQAVYDTLRIFLSHEFPCFAVPTFFLISGYLFFRKLETWDWQVYGQKLRRRLHTILIPYIGWNLFHCVHLCWPTLMGVFHGAKTWKSLGALVKALGGWHMLWTGSYHPSVVNVLGVTMVNTAPVLVPLWFLRDLMVVIVCAPLLYWLLRKGGRWVLALLAVCLVLNIWIPLPGCSVAATFWFGLGGYFTLYGHNLVATCYRYRIPFWVAWALLLGAKMGLALYYPQLDSYCNYIGRAVLCLVSVPGVVALAATFQQMGWLHDRPWLARSAFFVYCSHIFLRKQVIHLTLPLVPHTYFASLVYYLLVPLLTCLTCLFVRQLLVKCRLIKVTRAQ